jgi:hypothetical protein
LSLDTKEKQIGAGQFKQHCLAIIDEVAKKAKWFKKKVGENAYQLQRY